MSDDRTEWPTERHLSELREAGVVPYSPLSSLCVSMAAALGALWGTAPALGRLYDLWRSSLGDIGVALRDPSLVGDLVQVILAPPVAALAAVFVWGLFQTRFAVRFHRLGMNIARLNPFAVLDPVPGLKRLTFAVLGMVVVLGAAGLSALASISASFAPLARGAEYAEPWGQHLIRLFVPLAGLSLLVMAFSAWLIARLGFMLRHRMTRQEIEREARD